MQVGYASKATSDVEKKGYRLDMTNWASVLLSATAVPGGAFNIQTMLGSGGIFRSDLSLTTFITRFSPHAAATTANRQRRWREMLDRANGGLGLPPLLEKRAFNSPFPPTYLHYHDPRHHGCRMMPPYTRSR